MILGTRKLILGGSVIVLGAWLVACEKNNKSERTQTTGANEPAKQGGMKTLQTGTPEPNAPTIDRVTAARCDRLMACKRIGEGKKWADESACRRDLRATTSSELDHAACPTLSFDKVGACVAALASENCDSVEMGARDVLPCTKEVLCKSE